MKPLARIIVKETAGIRRFLYPLSLHLPNEISTRVSKIEQVRTCEQDGTLLPSQSRLAWPPREDLLPGAALPYRSDFAISLAPYEERELHLVETEDIPTIPDAMRLAVDENDGLTSQQERVLFHIGAKVGLDSVIYDSVQHLAGPLSITLNGDDLFNSGSFEGPTPVNEGLEAHVQFHRPPEKVGEFGFVTRYELTACKSWINVTHSFQNACDAGALAFSLPLRAQGETPTCDFGVGNGVYEKISGDAVVWTTEFGEKPYARWRVSTVNAGEERIDYQGEYQSPADFEGRAWFHFMEKTKALAVAIPYLPEGTEKLTVMVHRNGLIEIAISLGKRTPHRAAVRVCYHFLNDIPAIAAATNPASILLPPKVTFAPLT